MARSKNFNADSLFEDLGKETATETEKEITAMKVDVEKEKIKEIKPAKKEGDFKENPVKPPMSEIVEELESTRGKKGQKLPKLIFTCTQEIHDYITIESRRRGIPKNHLLNEIIKEYKDSPKGRAVVEY